MGSTKHHKFSKNSAEIPKNIFLPCHPGLWCYPPLRHSLSELLQSDDPDLLYLEVGGARVEGVHIHVFPGWVESPLKDSGVNAHCHLTDFITPAQPTFRHPRSQFRLWDQIPYVSVKFFRRNFRVFQAVMWERCSRCDDILITRPLSARTSSGLIASITFLKPK